MNPEVDLTASLDQESKEIPNSVTEEQVVEPIERTKALLNFIEKEPVMKWLLHRVDEARKRAWEKGTNSIDQCLGDSCVVLMTREDNEGETEEGAAMVYDWERKEWVILQGENFYDSSNQFFIGKTLDIQKIISALGLTGHEIMEAASIYN